MTYFDRFGLRFYIGRDLHLVTFRSVGFALSRSLVLKFSRSFYGTKDRQFFGWRLIKLRGKP